jgi:hypothetical protein
MMKVTEDFGTDRLPHPDPDPNPLVRGTDSSIRIRIRIRNKMSRIPNTATNCTSGDVETEPRLFQSLPDCQGCYGGSLL